MRVKFWENLPDSEPAMRKTLILSLWLLLFTFTSHANDAMVKTTNTLLLGETEVRINVYEHKGANVTFIAPHFNELTANKVIKEMIEISGGRFVEIESFDEAGKPARRVSFNYKGKSYSIDPNRIYTENGRACTGVSAEIEPLVKNFADSLLKLALASEGNRLREGEKFLVALHNNVDVDSKDISQQGSDLTVFSFTKPSKINPLGGSYFEQAEGVYLSNVDYDEDNFVFLATPMFSGFFVERGFNVVIQTAAAKQPSKRCSIDDGSLSVYAAQQNIPYINLEADITNGAYRQRAMINSVYRLFYDLKAIQKN